MSESEIPAVIAEQEEHLKRVQPCRGFALTPHTFRDFGRPATEGTIANAAVWRQCIRCGVTETSADYHQKLKG
jgi:hypothetical protein